MAVNVPSVTPNRRPADWHKPGGQMIGGGLTGGVNVGQAGNRPPGIRGYGGNDGNGNAGGYQHGILSAFLPGQQAALAQQLNQGFGGGLKQWNGILGETYSPQPIQNNPLGYPRPGHGGKNDGKDGDGTDNTDASTQDGWTSGGFNPHSSAPYMMQQPGQPSSQMQPVAQPNVAQPMLQPVNGPMPQVPQGLSPQVIALLRARFGGR